ncbi:hypothetical protein NC651_013028 [Populus alba x Populus x berolinensis]|nr:hypothetical protein NC651_013028 [Populus alba x Populus x berolinensis]
MGPLTLAVDTKTSSKPPFRCTYFENAKKQSLLHQSMLKKIAHLISCVFYFEGVIAGGTAGVVVETALYPIDTIKTRLQAGEEVLKNEEAVDVNALLVHPELSSEFVLGKRFQAQFADFLTYFCRGCPTICSADKAPCMYKSEDDLIWQSPESEGSILPILISFSVPGNNLMPVFKNFLSSKDWYDSKGMSRKTQAES